MSTISNLPEWFTISGPKAQFTMRELAQILNLSYDCVKSRVERGTIPKPEGFNHETRADISRAMSYKDSKIIVCSTRASVKYFWSKLEVLKIINNMQ